VTGRPTGWPTPTRLSPSTDLKGRTPPPPPDARDRFSSAIDDVDDRMDLLVVAFCVCVAIVAAGLACLLAYHLGYLAGLDAGSLAR
jgi:hypothetical protein